MSSAAECTFHVASLMVRGFLAFLELLESDGELLESDGELLETDGDEKDCFAMWMVLKWCF